MVNGSDSEVFKKTNPIFIAATNLLPFSICNFFGGRGGEAPTR
jgi:hypothetical protein